MKRVFISFLLLFFILFIAFFFFGSSRNLGGSEYNQLVRYKANPFLPGTDTLKVMTYNIGYLSGMTNNMPVDREYSLFEENLQKAVAMIRIEAPHIIGFQEIDFSSERSFEQDQADSIALTLGYPIAYKSVNWDKRYVPFPLWPLSSQFGEVVSGQSILSMFPVENPHTETLIKPVNTSFLYDAFYLDRLVQICDIRIGDRMLKVLNIHLEAFDEETRIEQAHMVKRLYEQYTDTMPVLVIGDFNSRNLQENEFNGAMKVILDARHIEASIGNSVYSKDPARYYTFSSEAPFQMIDYILFNTNFIRKIDSDVIREAGVISDHLPVVMKFVLRPENE